MTTEIISSVSIEAMVARRNAVIERFVAIREHALVLQQLEKEAMGGVVLASLPEIVAGRFHYGQFGIAEKKAVEEYTKRVDSAFWRALLERAQMEPMMSNAVREQWSQSLEDGTAPEFTMESVLPTLEALYTNRHGMLAEAVVEIFRARSWDKVSNRPEKFTAKQIWHYGTSVFGYTCDWLNDLHRTLHVLDGKPEPDYNGTAKGLIAAGCRVFNSPVGSYEHDYWTLTIFKNGNAHLVIKRQDLVDRLNDIIATRYPFALPGSKA